VNTLIFWLVAVAVLTLAIYAAWRAGRRRSTKAEYSDSPLKPRGAVSSSEEELLPGTDLLLVDQHGNTLISSRQLLQMPDDAQQLTEKSGIAIRRASQLAADFFKGAVGLPNRTVELVFSPKVQQGLIEGVLEIVPAKAGGVLAQARRVDNSRLAGHGRIVEGGRMRQLAAGAFQLVSIAVAQSHLEDINRNLNQIKDAIGNINQRMDSKDKAQLAGTVAYLEYLVSTMNAMKSPDEVSVEKRVQLETIYREALVWIENLTQEAGILKSQILGQQDVDSWGGTEHTYKALMAHVSAAQCLLEKRSVLLRLMALLNVGMAYIDPLGKQSLPVSLTLARPDTFEAITGIAGSLRDRSNQLLSNATWNKKQTLHERRDEVVEKSELFLKNDKEEHASYNATMERLNASLKTIRRSNGEVRMAFKFDGSGAVAAVSVL
jgi:hypothetical protein